MGPVEKYIEEIDAYEERLIENLTVNDALIVVAVCAAKETADMDNNPVEDAKRIVAFARDYPLFSDLSDHIVQSVNRFMNMIKRDDTVNYIRAAAKSLTPEHKKTAFTWAAMILLWDGVLTEAKKRILDKYLLLLDIDKHVARQILLRISNAV